MPIRVNPFHSIRYRFLIPAFHGTSSAFSISPKMAGTASSSQSQPDSHPRRPVCSSCSKPVQTCLCARIRCPGLDNSVAVTVLQHSLEKKHPLNSTRIVKLGLKNATVATLHDVNFDARFSIWFLGKESEVGLAQKGVDCTDSGQEVEIKNAQRQELGFLDGVSSRAEDIGESEIDMRSVQCPEAKNPPLVDRDEFSPGGWNPKGGDRIARDSELLLNYGELVINIFMGRKGVISSIEHTLKADIHQEERLNKDDILAPELARNLFLKGFVVRKLQRRQVNPSLEEVEECEEFELAIPAGSVLLFPTKDAVSVDELRARDFEVKNLIVLDGTWLKARRMYSENPWLRFLPHLKLDPQVRSLYREVRSQPKAGCLSTLESIVYTLKALGDDCSDDLDNLLEVFGSMVEDQRRCKHERLNKASRSTME
ncbi:hypothetical protein CDL15_Pgr006356 [Punica granatum]|nr:hypothetical protein CDL15_Pgr006356 [Punica granatum]